MAAVVQDAHHSKQHGKKKLEAGPHYRRAQFSVFCATCVQKLDFSLFRGLVIRCVCKESRPRWRCDGGGHPPGRPKGGSGGTGTPAGWGLKGETEGGAPHLPNLPSQ